VLFGTVRVGYTDYCLASFTGATSVSYQWLSDLNPISGATSSTYRIPASLFHKTLRCEVTAKNGSASSTGLSNGYVVGTGSPLRVVRDPVLQGSHKAHSRESVTTGRWSPGATTVTYQWYLDGVKVAGATRSTFWITYAEKGERLHCVVGASAYGYAKGYYATPAVKIT
jgi:hypothetical protein